MCDTANQKLAFGLQLTGKSATKQLGQNNQSCSRNVGFQFPQLEEDSERYRIAERCPLLIWLLNSNDIFSYAP